MAGREAMKRLTLVEMLSLLALTVAVLAVVLPVMGTWRERPLIEAMRANLRNLAAAQESYFYDFRGYSGDLEGLRRTGFTPSDGVRLLIREATRAGWSAIASHPETRIQCFLFVRDAARAGSAAVAGTVHCS